MHLANQQRLAIHKSSSLCIQVVRLIVLCVLLCYNQYSHAEKEPNGRIIKWKDEKGVTHYGDRIPPQYSNSENSLINRQGVTVQRNKPINYQKQAVDLVNLEQDKKDKALLSAFTNADEIDLARDRNIQLDLIALDNLQQDKINSQKKLAANKALADGYLKREKPVPADLSADILSNQAGILKIDTQINDRKLVIKNTRKRFDDDKSRYLLLKNHINRALPDSETTPASVKPASIPSKTK